MNSLAAKEEKRIGRKEAQKTQTENKRVGLTKARSSLTPER